jgi:hypothetical protein
MLGAMEIALGVLLGLLGVALAALGGYLVARRTRLRTAAAAPSGTGADDDLPGFLESPPGTTDGPSPPQAGWAALAPVLPARPTEVRPRGRDSRLVPGVVAVVGVLLIALAAALLTGRHSAGQHRQDAGRAADHGPASSDGLTARLSFGGVVLERHAVGVTAGYPGLEVSSDGERSVAHLELPTFHCLTGEAPEDPVAAGCRRSGTEYADLDSPALSLTGSAERLRLSGDFPTYLRLTGGGVERTGRVYPIEVSAVSVGGTVEGTLDLGAEHAETTPDTGVNVLSRGS